MSLPVELVNEGIDWPAWVQAVGSILAIVLSTAIAIWIDQGAARRNRDALDHAARIAAEQQAAAEQRELTAHAEKINDWRRALADGVEVLENMSRAVPNNRHPDEFRQADTSRVIRNMAGTIQMYLIGGPPNPHLGWALFAVHAELMAAQAAVDAWSRDDALGIQKLSTTLAQASRMGRQISDEYHGGVR